MKLYDFYKSELIKKGLNEFIDENGRLILFDNESQFTRKILSYDADIETLTNQLFNQLMLENETYDKHFKRMFLMEFIHRRIGRQTVEQFQFALMSVFLTHEQYINSLYRDLDKYIHNMTNSESFTNTSNESTNTNNSTTDNRSANTTLPQNNVNLDLNNDVMRSADDNSISKSLTNQDSTSKTISDNDSYSNTFNYNLDNFIRSKDLFRDILNSFDTNCFYQLGG